MLVPVLAVGIKRPLLVMLLSLMRVPIMGWRILDFVIAMGSFGDSFEYICR